MATKVKQSQDAPRSAIDPNRIYAYAEIAEFYGGPPRVTARTVRNWVEAGNHPFTPYPGGRGRGISGRQYLDTIAALAVDAES